MKLFAFHLKYGDSIPKCSKIADAIAVELLLFSPACTLQTENRGLDGIIILSWDE